MTEGTKEFLLGILVAAALIFLWRKEQQHAAQGAVPVPAQLPDNAATGGCLGCTASPSMAASPDVQAQSTTFPARGTVSPGTPPLGTAGSAARDTSFLATGSNAISYPITRQPAAGTAPSGSFAPGTAAANPPRAVETVGQYSNLGFSHVTGTNLANATTPTTANVGTPVPAGFPTNQLYQAVNGSVWRYNPQTHVWFQAGTTPSVPVASTVRTPTPTAVISAPRQPIPVSQISVNRIAIGTRRVA